MNAYKQFLKILYKDGTEVAINVDKIISFTIRDGRDYAAITPCKVVEFIVEGIQKNIKVPLTNDLRLLLSELSNDISLYNAI